MPTLMSIKSDRIGIIPLNAEHHTVVFGEGLSIGSILGA